MTEPAKEVELKLSDAYHRAKRAAMAFSSLVLLAAFAQGSPKYSGFSISLPVLQIMLWGAAAYHTALFRMEFKGTIRRHSAFMTDRPAADFDERVGMLGAELARASEQISMAVHNIKVEPPARHSIANELGQRVKLMLEALVRDPKGERPGNISGSDVNGSVDKAAQLVMEGVLLRLDQAEEEQSRKLLHNRELELAQVDGVGDKIMTAAGTIEKLRGDITTLSSAIVAEQRVIIQHYDRTAVYALFWIATAAAAIAVAAPLICCPYYISFERFC